jgi:hypothetical protein
MKVWIIRYFLTEGIFLSEEGVIDNFGHFRAPTGRWDCQAMPRHQYRLTLEEALEYANRKRAERLHSLRNQIEKLEAMTWKK